MHLLVLKPVFKVYMSCFLVCLSFGSMYRQSAIGLALNVTVTEFVDMHCMHILACMTPLNYFM